MLLTYLGALEGDEENQIENEEPETKSGQRFYVAACPRLDGRHAAAQRFVVYKDSLLSESFVLFVSVFKRHLKQHF